MKQFPKQILYFGICVIFGMVLGCFFVQRGMNLKSEASVDLSLLYKNDLTCTGLTYDEKNDSFWVNNLGYTTPDCENEYSPSIVEFSREWGNVCGVIDLKEVFPGQTINLQGLAYDSSTDSLWIVNSDVIVNLTKNGEVISSMSLGEYSQYSANGLCYDAATDSLWVLFYHNYLVQYAKDESIKRVIKCDYKDQDQLFFNSEKNEIWITVGADYDGEENYIYAVDLRTGNIRKKFKLLDSYAVEGLVVVDDILYVANDGVYHSARRLANYVAIYRLPD